MLLGSNRFFSYVAWVVWKKLQVFVRAHLLHVLAISLGIWVIIRAFPELKLIDQFQHIRWPGVLGLVLILGTICAVLWELFGNKRPVSKQEVRFVVAMLSLLRELGKFTNGRDREPDINERLDKFVGGFLEITQNALCGTKRVYGGLMIEVPGTRTMRLVKSSKSAYFPKDYVIPLPDSSNTTATDPIGVAYTRLQVVYMPQKSSKLSFPFRLINGHYEAVEPIIGWVPSPSPEMERFKSVLCIPITIYEKKNTKEIFGVLIYGTISLDPFDARDFMMGECFSSVLALAFAAVRREAMEIRSELAADDAS